MTQVSRRIFLLHAGGSAAVLPLQSDAGQPNGAAPAASAGTAAKDADTYLFFNRDEAAFIEAATQRLIPPDALGPGALEAGVPQFIDRQLAGAWGAGERLYRAGPWQDGQPTQGYQLPFTPAELFRTALRGVQAELQTRGEGAFHTLAGEAQDAHLTRWQTGGVDLAGVPSKVFFESLLAMTVEGYFCDPVYGGNRGMAAWRMIGFPGAHASFFDLIDKHGIAYTAAPSSLSETRGHVHVKPDIPATAPAPSKPGGSHSHSTSR